MRIDFSAGKEALKIFFDVDGVLIDGWHAKPERRKPWDIFLQRDLGIRADQFQRVFFSTPYEQFPSLMHACVSGTLDLKEALAEVLPSLGYRGSVDSLLAYWFRKDCNINPGVMDAIERLSWQDDVGLYLATGQEHYRAAYLWDELRLRDLFKDIFYSARLGHLKNTPEFFAAVNRSWA